MYNPSRGSSSSSHSDTQRSSSSDYYNRGSGEGGNGGDRYSYEQDYSSSSASTERGTRRNRWDDKDSGGGGYRRQRDRSRSPVKDSSNSSSTDRDQRRRLIADNRSSNSSGNGDRLGSSNPSNNYEKKASNNWSDSSSDEEDRRYRRRGNLEDSKSRYESLSSRSEKLDLNSNGSYYGDGNSYYQQRPLELDNIQQQLVQPPPVAAVEPFRGRLYNPCTPLEGTALPRPSNGRSSGVISNDLGKESGFTALSTASAIVNRVAPSPVAPYTKPVAGIQMKLASQLKPAPVTAPLLLKPKSAKLASVFNVDDDDEEEEMPAECKMRMKNVGRETPTSAGPNSFGKTKMGFCNMNQIKERKLQEELLKKK